MKLELRLAKILAKEVAYRSYKDRGKKGFLASTITKGKDISVLASNGLPSVIYMLISIAFSVSLLELFSENITAIMYFSIAVLSLLLFLEAILVITQVASFTSTFIRDKLVEPIITTPIDEKTLYKAYFYALLLYWGGLAPIFVALPASVIISLNFYLGREYFSAIPILGLITAFLILFLGYSLGLGLGSYYAHARKKVSLRILSVFTWIAMFLLIYAPYYASQRLLPIITRGVTNPLIALMPFIGILFLEIRPIESIISATVTLMLLYFAYRFSRRKIKSIIYPEYLSSTSVEQTIMKPSKIHVKHKSLILSFLVKDLKLLARDPRRLANMMLLFIIPLLIFGFRSMSNQMSPVYFLLMAPFVGAFIGMGSENIFYVEGEAAQVLYYLPISRRQIALTKALATTVFGCIIAVIVLLIIYVFSRNLLLTITMFSSIVLSALGYSLLLSSIYTSSLPETPSAWSEATFSKGRKVLMKIIIVGIVIIAIVVFSIVTLPTILIAEDPIPTLITPLLVSSLVSLIIGIFALMLIVKDSPL